MKLGRETTTRLISSNMKKQVASLKPQSQNSHLPSSILFQEEIENTLRFNAIIVTKFSSDLSILFQKEIERTLSHIVQRHFYRENNTCTYL